VDVYTIVAREKRAIATRRAGLVITSVLTVAAIALAGSMWEGRGSPPAPAPAASGFVLVIDGQASADATAHRLELAFAAAIAAHAPGARWQPTGQPPEVNGRADQLKPNILFEASGSLSVDSRRGSVNLTVLGLRCASPQACTATPTGQQGSGELEQLLTCQGDDDVCVADTAPNGARMLFTSSFRAGHAATATATVRVELPGGRVLELGTNNYFAVDGVSVATQADTVLTRTQLTDLATDLAGQITG
jgi:hypothetical protein